MPRLPVILDGLPDAIARLAPALEALPFPEEELATCASCAMQPRPGVPADPTRPRFTARARCCTYHPDLANFLVGRALRRGGPGAATIRARLADPDGVTELGIRAGSALRARYRERAEGEYGCAEDLTCPFWVEGPLGCSIHLDRDAVCRTWHCRLSRGLAAHRAWMALKDVLGCIEETLARACAEALDPPAEGASAVAYEAWFVACAAHVDALDEAALAPLRGPRLLELTDAVTAAVAARDAPMPALLTPALRNWSVAEHGVVLIGWSVYDPVQAPSWIFQLLARLDGETPWREAVAATEAELGHAIGDDLVLSLYRRGLLQAPTDDVFVPGGMAVHPRM